jgi:aerobic carbon-monoxide dehydrogenase large subunit
MIGARVKRREDGRLLAGRGMYVDDVVRPHMLHAVLVRSPHAHAAIRGVDASDAARVPGFVRCFVAADFGPLKPIPVRMGPQDVFTPYLQQPIAATVARYAGEPVAVVLATSRYAAEDAAEAVRVEFEPLPAVASADAALETDAPGAHPSGNIVTRWEVALGDVAAGFREADAVVRERFTIHRQTAVPMETRGLVAEFDAGRRELTVWGPTKVPYFNRAVLSAMLGLGEGQIFFIEGDVGGGFGARGEFYPEDFLIPYAAIATGRPVKWIETRREHFLTINHSRGETIDLAVAGRRDGTLLAIDAALVHDLGAYVRTHGTIVPSLTAAHLPGPYRLPHYRCTVTCVTTNRTPMATMRGPGLFEPNFARERALDMLAAHLGVDAADIRRRNLVPADCIPYHVGTSVGPIKTLYDSGDFPAMFEQAMAASRTDGPRATPAGCLRGFGIAAIAEPSGFGPFESARVEVDTDGAVRIYTGATSQGQGQETTLAQVCSEVLGAPIEAITVTHGDTRLMKYGVGTFASRAAVTAGSAVYRAAERVRARALRIAARHLESSSDDLVVTDGRVHVSGFPDRFITLGEIARKTTPSARGPEAPVDAGEGLTETAYFHVTEETTGFAVHTAEVSVDPETGVVHVGRYVVAADAGRALNPTIVEAQLVGGAVQGISGALYEELAHDETGQLLTGTLMDYSLPTAESTCHAVESIVFESHTPSNPLGVKGVGEGGISGSGAAVANAVADALRALGVRIAELPLTPARVRRAIERARDGGAERP